MSLARHERILAACDKALAKGYRVEAGAWGVAWNPKRKRWSPLKHCRKRLCPIGALVLTEQPSPDRYCSVPATAAALLGVDIHWIIAFQMEFDGLIEYEGVTAKEVTRGLGERLQALKEGNPDA